MYVDMTSSIIPFLKNAYRPEKIPEKLPSDVLEHLLQLASLGDINARNTIIEHHYLLILKLAYKYIRPRIEIDDLFQVGVIGCIKSIEKYDSSKNIKFITFTTTCIRNEMLMYIRSFRLNKTIMQLDQPIHTNSKGEDIYLMDIISDMDNEIDNFIDKYSDSMILRDLMTEFMDVLPTKYKVIIMQRFGLDGKKPLTQQEISKNVNLTQSMVSRIIRNGIEENLIKAYNEDTAPKYMKYVPYWA